MSHIQKIPRQEFPEATDNQTRLEPPPEERLGDSNKFLHDDELAQWQKAFFKTGHLQTSYNWKEYTRHLEACSIRLGIQGADCEAGPSFMMTRALEKGMVQWRAAARTMTISLPLALQWYEPERGKTSTEHVPSGCNTICRSAKEIYYRACQARRHESKNVLSSTADCYYDEAGRNNDMMMAIADHQVYKTPTRNRKGTDKGLVTSTRHLKVCQDGATKTLSIPRSRRSLSCTHKAGCAKGIIRRKLH